MIHVAMIYASLLAGSLTDRPTQADVSAYQAVAAKAGRNADRHVWLASWCEAHGLNAERHKHLATALEIDPDHAQARGLLGQVLDRGEWRMAEVVIDDRRDDTAAAATLALYRARRVKIPDTAQAHWQLAEWCEQNGLKGQATAHYTAVARLNPAREEAWKKLGYRKQKGRWTPPDQSASLRTEADAQRRADAKWRPLLQKWKGWLDQKPRRAEAVAGMATVNDPRAVPSIWKVFIAGGPADQERAIGLLRQIDAPAASRALGSLAVLGASDEVRLSAADCLARRDPREFAPLLISLLRDPIKYEIKPVEGPGKPGELYVHGERANRRFFYASPPPLTEIRPTDVVGFDDNGLPVATRVVGYTNMPVAAAVDPLLQGAPDLTGAPAILGRTLGKAGVQLGERMLQNQQAATLAGAEMAEAMAQGPNMPVPPLSAQSVQNNAMQAAAGGPMVTVPVTAQVPVGRLMVQAQQQAAFSRTRLQEDVAALDRYNKDVHQVNDRASTALETALLANHGPDRKAWVKWWTDVVESASSASPTGPRDKGPEVSRSPVDKRAIIPAFGAGTPVWTMTGRQPIETIRAGDMVLTRETSTGALTFAPVLMIHQGEAQPLKEISIGGEPTVATEIERFWVAGKGWIMVLELREGDLIRGLRESLPLGPLKDAGARPVFHVQVAGGRGILVGEQGLFAHDEGARFSSGCPLRCRRRTGGHAPGPLSASSISGVDAW